MLTFRALPTVIAVAAAGLVACGDSGDSGGDTTEAAGEPTIAASFEVPFGLDELEGVEPIGRPAVVDRVYGTYEDQPVMALSVRAAYRVTADDPPAVVRDALGGLDGLTLDEASIRGIGDPSCPDCVGPGGIWITGSASQESTEGFGDHAELQLWATDDGPVLLVALTRIVDNPEPPRIPTIDEDTGTGADADAPSPADSPARSAGDVLFTEQGDDIHVPAGTRTLVPTLPESCGTGGSTSVVAADDGEAAVQAMVDEARGHDEYGEVDGPDVTTIDGIDVIEASFVIPAGGWGFDVLAVRGPDDPYATVYVSSCAD
jgi:hypothetical protein